jgi:hypothetical protein
LGLRHYFEDGLQQRHWPHAIDLLQIRSYRVVVDTDASSSSVLVKFPFPDNLPKVAVEFPSFETPVRLPLIDGNKVLAVAISICVPHAPRIRACSLFLCVCVRPCAAVLPSLHVKQAAVVPGTTCFRRP